MRSTNIFTLAFLLNCFTSRSLAQDPLQPVWDMMSQIPDEINEKLQEMIMAHTSDVHNHLDKRINELKNHMTSLESAKPTEDPTQTDLKESLKDALTDSLKQVYDGHMKEGNQNAFLSPTAMTSQLYDFERKVNRHLDEMLSKTDLIFEFNSTIEDHVFEILHQGAMLVNKVSDTDRRSNIVREQVTSMLEDEEQFPSTCSSMLDKVQRYADGNIPNTQRIQEFEKRFDETYHNVVGEFPKIFFQRDCSDILWSQPEALSGVYNIYPTRSIKETAEVWCQMKGDDKVDPGWTVILRRRKTPQGLLNFNRTWAEYAAGFGEPGKEGEWWLGLKWIHALTYNQPYQIKFLIHDIEDGNFHAEYSNFRVEDEDQDFRLIVDGFGGTVSDAFKKHHGQPFSTYDRDNDQCACNCAVNNGGGWWFNICHNTVLTAVFPTSNSRDAKTIRWLDDKWLVLDDVTVMIKPQSN